MPTPAVVPLAMLSTSYDTFNNNPDVFSDVDSDVDTIMANVHNMVLAYYWNGACIPDDMEQASTVIA
jgi:hypothetical protein